jgi:hypothetical protein
LWRLLSFEKSEREHKFDLGGHLSEERDERDLVLSRLLNGDVSFFCETELH